MALAYRAGAPLKDMEFVQYHPTGLPFTGILITEAARAEGGWLLNKDGYRYLQDYDLGTPTPTPELRSMELGPRDRLSQAFVARGREGPDIGLAVRADRPPRPAAPGRGADRGPDPVRARAVPEVRADRPGARADPGPPGRALHDGRRPHRHPRRDPARGPVRRGRDRLRDHQRREPARLELAARVPRLRCPGRSGGRGVRRDGRRSRRPPSQAQVDDEARRIEAADGHARRRTTAYPRSATRCRRRWRRRPASTAPGRTWPRAATLLKGLQERVERVGVLDTSRSFNTELVAALELANMLDIAECILESGLRREESRGAHQRTDFPARDDERFLTHQLALPRAGRRRRGSSSCR